MEEIRELLKLEVEDIELDEVYGFECDCPEPSGTFLVSEQTKARTQVPQGFPTLHSCY